VIAPRNAAGSSPQPRWIRINALKTSLNEEIRTTFSSFTECSAVEQLCTNTGDTKAYVRDPNIPDLLAINASAKGFTRSSAFEAGKIILQDKASCFPAHLLLNSKLKFSLNNDISRDGDLLDACAAPGNKTSHAASMISIKPSMFMEKAVHKRVVFACERDAKRSLTLQSMLDRAGAASMVKVLAKQDFLALDPLDRTFSNVTHLLLDPSCSGSGILGRDDVPTLVLPKDPRNGATDRSEIQEGRATGSGAQRRTKKRKRDVSPSMLSEDAEVEALPASVDTNRLQKLSNLQTRIIEHAFAFPSALLVTYSTCSIHAVENEMVVLRALNSTVARKRCWRVLRRDEQPEGLRMWPHRGDDLIGDMEEGIVRETCDAITNEERKNFTEACIRCKPGGKDGTMGFFVVGFVRDPRMVEDSKTAPNGTGVVEQYDDDDDDDDEWKGFSADEDG
jgi:25S rRNA (cytosine2278-C5)-methyltransferase